MLTLETFLCLTYAYCAEHAIPLCFARRYDRPNLAHQRDIDLVLRHSDLKSFLTFLRACPGVTVVSCIAKIDSTQIILHGIYTPDAVFFCLDIQHRFSYRGLSYLPAHAVLLRSQPDDAVGFGQRPSPIDLALIYLFTHVLKHRRVDDTVIDVIQTGYKSAHNVFRDLITLYFGVRGTAHLKHFLSQPVVDDIRRLRRLYNRQTLRQHGIMAILSRFNDMVRIGWQRVFNRHDVRVAVIGTDGAGKTHAIHLLIPGLKNLRPDIVHAHVYPAWPGQHEPDSTRTNPTPHALPNRHWIMSNLKLIYLVIRYWIDALWPHRGSRVIIHDRYLTDIIVDPKRFRFQGSDRLARLAVRLLPRLHVMIWLSTPAIVAHKRKPELPLDVMHAHYQHYATIIMDYPDHVIVDGTYITSESIQRTIACLVAILARDCA